MKSWLFKQGSNQSCRQRPQSILAVSTRKVGKKTMATEQAQTCPICLEEFPLDEGAKESVMHSSKLVSLSCCEHRFCEPCLLSHFAETIQCRRSSVVNCPFITSCGKEIENRQIEDILSRGDDQDLLPLWNRLLLRKEHPDWPECPFCHAIVDPLAALVSADSSGTTKNSDCLECQQCKKIFLQAPRIGDSKHDTATLASEALLDAQTVPCSHCGARLQRSRGCSYVVCSACHNDMCYDCRTHIYLSEGRLRYCTKCSSALAGHGQATCAMNCLLVISFFLMIFLWFTLATVVAVVTLGCCAGYCCGRGLKHKEEGKKWAPIRGWIAVPVTIFLPCLRTCSVRTEGFVDRHVPFFLSDLVADEIPAMNTVRETIEHPVDDGNVVDENETKDPNSASFRDIELGEVTA